MRLKVLGSAAGGGFPQWNCNCFNCAGLRAGTIQAVPRTQSSVAISSNGADWLLINASPDILEQIKRTPALQQARAVRDSGIAAALVIDAQIDHTTGLLMLRERGQPLPLYVTPEVQGDLTDGFSLTRMLSFYAGLEVRTIDVQKPTFSVPFLQDIEITAVPLTSQPPPYSPHREHPRTGDTIGLSVFNRRTGRRLFYAPGLGRMEPQVLAAMQAADVVLVDGTFWAEDEMVVNGLSSKLAAEMGHLPQSGPGGMVEVLGQLPRETRKVLIHINNTNPILREDSEQRADLTAQGIEVAFDGMEIEL